MRPIRRRNGRLHDPTFSIPLHFRAFTAPRSSATGFTASQWDRTCNGPKVLLISGRAAISASERTTAPFNKAPPPSARNRAETPSGCPEGGGSHGGGTGVGCSGRLRGAVIAGSEARDMRGVEQGAPHRPPLLPEAFAHRCAGDGRDGVRVNRRDAVIAPPLAGWLADRCAADPPTMPVTLAPSASCGHSLRPPLRGHPLPSRPFWRGRRHVPEFGSGTSVPCVNNWAVRKDLAHTIIES